MTLQCQTVIEKLPWLLHGSLEEQERRSIEQHLAACEDCRRELTATRDASGLFSGHVPAEALVDYALGEPVEELSRTVLEAHLAHCATCRQEVELVLSEGAVPAEMPRTPPNAERWRALALAASILAVLGLATGLRPLLERPAVNADVAVVEVTPQSSLDRGSLDRGSLDPGTGERGNEVATIDPTRTSTVLLISNRAERFDDVRARILDGDGALRVEVAGLRADAHGDYPLLLPPGTLEPGPAILELAGRAGNEWVAIESYRVLIQP